MKKVSIRIRYIKEEGRMGYFIRDDGSYFILENHIKDSFRLIDGDSFYLTIISRR